MKGLVGWGGEKKRGGDEDKEESREAERERWERGVYFNRKNGIREAPYSRGVGEMYKRESVRGCVCVVVWSCACVCVCVVSLTHM